jgi:hypothetical protein
MSTLVEVSRFTEEEARDWLEWTCPLGVEG